MGVWRYFFILVVGGGGSLVPDGNGSDGVELKDGGEVEGPVPAPAQGAHRQQQVAEAAGQAAHAHHHAVAQLRKGDRSSTDRQVSRVARVPMYQCLSFVWLQVLYDRYQPKNCIDFDFLWENGECWPGHGFQFQSKTHLHV